LPTPVTAAEKMGLCCENWVEKWGENSGGGQTQSVCDSCRAESCKLRCISREKGARTKLVAEMKWQRPLAEVP